MEDFNKSGGDCCLIRVSEPIIVRPEIKSHGGSYFLSNLDHFYTGNAGTLYVYKPENYSKGDEMFSDVIKQSLAKILVHYPPLAGRLRQGYDGKLFVECTDDGVLFVDAMADCDIDVVDTKVPGSAILNNLLYGVLMPDKILDVPILTVQVTRFRSGGFVLGMNMNHCLLDGIAAMAFIKSWAEIARGKPLTNQPALDRTMLKSRKPPRMDFPFHEFAPIKDTSDLETLYQEPLLSKCLHFDSNKLARLKCMAMEDGKIKSCTNFTVLTAFTWCARSKALKMKPEQMSVVIFMVNVRSKLNPPLPEGYAGNGTVATGCACKAGELAEKPFSFAVEQVQNAVQRVTDDYIRSWIDYLEVNRERETPVAVRFAITSWIRLSPQNGDFGWGEPAEFGVPFIPKSLGIFLPYGKEKCINLLLSLPADAMNTFQELLKF